MPQRPSLRPSWARCGGYLNVSVLTPRSIFLTLRSSTLPILAHGEVKGRSVKMSDSLDFGHIHFVTQQFTFSLLFYYQLSQNVMTRPPIWNQTICDKKESPQCVHTPEGDLSTNSTHFPKHKRQNIDTDLIYMCRNADCIT